MAGPGQGPVGKTPGPAAAAPLSPFQRLVQARHLRDLSGDGGVLKEVLRRGAGELVPPDASVAVKYSGYLEYAEEPFCTNCYRKLPRLMKLGKDITLGGLEIGLLTMKKGEMARFVFMPNYAYGKLGCPPLIPLNATVLFEVEVLDFLDSAESDRFFALTAEQQGVFPLEKVLKVADTEREFGNYLYRQQHFMDAKDRYKRACLCMTEYEKARDFLIRAQHIQPFNHDINNELKKLARTSPADEKNSSRTERRSTSGHAENSGLHLCSRKRRKHAVLFGEREVEVLFVYTQPIFLEAGSCLSCSESQFSEELSLLYGRGKCPLLLLTLFEGNFS
ncbi:inactive peptidyl-prolyl cis-trans isomerase FKBP6 isoform X3 [Struthio camelus]|uniref:inactive peptidyl-prolyl cis-trans isomerase FKBP6 isoform X3 n=1 Tax=Struthio camelus TaxID=8801 RepID=UPI003604002B